MQIKPSLYDAYAEADRSALAAAYIERIGYDPFEDDPTISIETVRQTLAEYDEVAAAHG